MPRTVRTAPARKAAERTTAARPATTRAKRAAPAKTPAKTGTGTSKDVMTTVQTEPAAEIVGMDGLDAEVATAATMDAGTLTEAPRQRPRWTWTTRPPRWATPSTRT